MGKGAWGREGTSCLWIPQIPFATNAIEISDSGREMEPGLRRRPGSNGTFDGKPLDECSVYTGARFDITVSGPGGYKASQNSNIAL